MTSIDFNAYRHPVLAVPCRTCRARAGAWCKRPSGHKASDFHRDRKDEADRAWLAQGSPTIVPLGCDVDAGAEPGDNVPMTQTDFRALLEAAELKQIELVRLLRLLGGHGDQVTVNRWTAGRQAPPAAAVAFLAVWPMLAESKRRALLKRAAEL